MFKQKFTGKQKLFRQLKRLAPEFEDDLTDNLAKSGKELETMVKSFAPRKSGDYVNGISVRKIKDGDDGARNNLKTIPAFGLFAPWFWRFIEHGTAASEKGGRTSSGRKSKRSHPGTSPRPHIFPAWRVLRKRIRGRTTRAINKSVKRITG